MSTPASFSGFPAGALSFYAELEDRNSRDWWLAHKDVYERDVREPMLALLDGLEASTRVRSSGPARSSATTCR